VSAAGWWFADRSGCCAILCVVRHPCRSPLLLVVALLLLPLHAFAATADTLSVVCFGRDGHVDIESRAGHHKPVPSIASRAVVARSAPVAIAAPLVDRSTSCVDAALVAPTSPERLQPMSRANDAAALTVADSTAVPAPSGAGPPVAAARGPAHLTVLQTTVLRI